jgi:hypothetical protein
MVWWQRFGKAGARLFALPRVSAWIVVLLAGGAAGDAIFRHEDAAFVALLVIFLVGGLAITTTSRLRNAALPIAEALGAVAGALLALSFGAGLTDDAYLRAPSFGQLLFSSLGIAQAVIVARIRVAAIARQRDTKLDEQIQELVTSHRSMLHAIHRLDPGGGRQQYFQRRRFRGRQSARM